MPWNFYRNNQSYLLKSGLIPSGDVLVLAGDIRVLEDGYESHPFFSWAADNFDQVYFLLGNHEYYSGYPLSVDSHLYEQIRSAPAFRLSRFQQSRRPNNSVNTSIASSRWSYHQPLTSPNSNNANSILVSAIDNSKRRSNQFS